VTQNFHLPRSLYIAKNLGLDACGMKADLHSYAGEEKRNKREFLAKVKAWLNVNLQSKPKYLGEKILITGDSLESWD
jgi:SanA protein